MADDRAPPILNPVLSLQMEPTPKGRRGGGKGRHSIVSSRLPAQQRKLRTQAQSLYTSRAEFPAFGGKALLAVHMFPDSLAPSHTPNDLFAPDRGCRLVAPLRKGYLVETDLALLPRLVAVITSPPSFAMQADISRVSDMMAFDDEARLRGRSIDDLWGAAPDDEEGRLFILWLTPFRDRGAREALLGQVGNLEGQAMQPVFPRARLPALTDEETGETRPVPVPRQSSIARAMRGYRNTGVGRALVRVPDKKRLAALVASGTSHRIDPVRPIRVTSPGAGRHPVPPLELDDAPTVGVIDGGLHAASYEPAEAWRAPALIPDDIADHQHGNSVSSLAVHAHAWNNNRSLPALDCRIGTVQAVPQRNSAILLDEYELTEYLDAIVRDRADTRVWNISANQGGPGLNPEAVSALGHELTLLARQRSILPVVSIGNVEQPYNTERLCPPADCEAAVVVGGRDADDEGKPGQACSVCLSGPGPDGMLKPDVSWFSRLRMIGGVTRTGSSFATPLVSSLAAHTFAALRDPTPDLVKALLINAAELDEHNAALGWGTPYHDGHLPWGCEPGSVTLAWRDQLEPGTDYYWNDIPIPPELIRNGKLFGRARLTAILNPLVSPFGDANYFASRLQTALQYVKPDGKWGSLLGSMKESTIPESDARELLRKWQPVRRHCNDFTRKGGWQFVGNSLRLYARVFTRDLYQFGWSHHSQAGPQEAVFVLTLWSGDGQPSIYNSTVQALGNFVESAVLEQDIEQEIEG